MITLELTKNELRALLEMTEGSHCESTCCYPEMVNKKIDCSECPFSRDSWSTREKIIKLCEQKGVK